MSLTPEELDRQLKKIRQQESEANKPKPALGNSGSSGLRMGTELVSALMVGGFLGYVIDGWLDCRPWFMISLLVLGFVAGLVNIYRAQTGQDYKIGFKTDDHKKD